MRNLLLVRFGEIFLKGLNRPYFMKELVKKIRFAVKDVASGQPRFCQRLYRCGRVHSPGDEGVRRTQRVPRSRNGEG